MEMAMDVLFGIGGIFILLLCVAGSIAVLVVLHEFAEFAGRKLARTRRVVNATVLCRWMCGLAALTAMALSFVLVNGTTNNIAALIGVMVLKGILGALVAGTVTFIAMALVGRPFLRAFDAEKARVYGTKAIVTYV